MKAAVRDTNSVARRKPKKGRRSGGASKPAPHSTGPERLQKLLARGGYGSRRSCEELITGGRVTVDGELATELGTRADPAEQDIRVDGSRLRAEASVYYLVNKPRAVLCTRSDPKHRRTVMDLVPQERRRIFPIGRLDYDSRGAVILTNDGRLTNLLTHPRYGIEKTYWIRLRGRIDGEALDQLRRGVWLSEGRTLPARVWVIKKRKDETEMGIAICEGKNRQVRRMLAKVGHKVLGLTRTRIGPITLKGLGDGDSRVMRPQEVEMLVRLAQQNAKEPPSQSRGRRSRSRSHGKPDPAQAPGNPGPASRDARGNRGRRGRNRKGR